MIVNAGAYRNGKRLGDVRLEDISEVLKEPDTFVWLGLREPALELLREVQKEFSLHDLAIEDALHAHQRPKIEVYGESLFIVVETAQIIEEKVRFGETHLFVGKNFIVTVRHGPSVSYTPVREKCEALSGQLVLGPGFALYAVLDFVVDNYQPVAERLRDKFEDLEQRIFATVFDRDAISRLYSLKKDLVKLQDAVLPIQDICTQLVRLHEDVVRRELRAYFRDVEDHVARIVKLLDAIREMLTTAIQVNLSLVTVGQNEVVKRLAGWGAILAIPTVVFSNYGMNFRFMPELTGRWSYPLVLLATLVACAVLYRRLRRNRWI